MTSGPLVSIVTPTFNRADYLREAIDSVSAQTYANFEHLIVDDGSTDDTAGVVASYGDERLRYFRQENQGQSVARNVGIENSRGEFICFLDSDNAWVPDKLRQQLEAFESHPEAGVVYGDIISIDAEGSEFSRRNMRRHSGWITEALLGDNFVSMNTTMTHTELLRRVGGFDPADRYAEDYGLWLRVSLHAPFAYVPECWAYYRIMENQISSDKLIRLEANESLIQSFIQEHADQLDFRQVREALSRFHERKGRHEASGGRRWVALASGVRTVRYAPGRTGAWRSFLRILFDVVR
ncbi:MULTISPECIES: glycosyltransferase [Halomonadaceae]|uniref:Glycosyltransferase n=1 Tax=Vreelandella halophila TaxID=86177 RepID=A0A9X5B5S9_9GAMM|nr:MULTISPECIES: glycosyltransferase [Halomonas]MYL26818.1 glycosyltransferase [Halomonas utahensis]MYL74079.1 glycosyltransferase [Halomonas sp. 22501_18_FS]